MTWDFYVNTVCVYLFLLRTVNLGIFITIFITVSASYVTVLDAHFVYVNAAFDPDLNFVTLLQ